jgi:hypothetical protein
MNSGLLMRNPALSAGEDCLSIYLHSHVQEPRDVQPAALTLDDS